MKHNRLFFFIAFWVCSITSFASVEATAYKFRTMSPEGGFYYDGVKAIEQDNAGFIWVMMDYELYRFDGYEYKKYHSYFASMDSTKRWILHNMASDSEGHLYVNTNNGIYMYDGVSDHFRRIFDAVSIVKTDKVDNLWVRHGNLWSILDVGTGELITPCHDEPTPTGSNLSLCTYNKDLYSFIGRKIYRFNHAGNKFEHCLTLPGSSREGIRFAAAHKGKMCVFIDKEGLYEIDLSTFKTENRYGPWNEFNANSLRAFHIDKNGKIWFGTIDRLYILDPVTRHLSAYQHSDTDPFSLPNNSVWTISEDRQSNIWIGTYSGKLCYVNLNENCIFQTFNTRNSGLSYVPVSAFAEDDRYLWIGTEGGGVNRMEKATRTFSSFANNDDVSFRNIKSLVIGPQRNLWISTFREGMDMYSPGQNRVVNYRNIPRDTTSLLVNNIRKTILEADSGVWVAYQYPVPQISYFSLNRKTFTHFSLDSIGNYAFLFDILRQGEKTLWAITNEALYRMDTHTYAVQKIVPDDSTYLGLFTFCLDDAGNIWIGTIGNGLVEFDTNTSTFTSLKEGMEEDIYSIYSICYTDGNVWMGTDQGLYCYNIAHNHLLNFDKQENTQGQVLSLIHI